MLRFVISGFLLNFRYLSAPVRYGRTRTTQPSEKVVRKFQKIPSKFKSQYLPILVPVLVPVLSYGVDRKIIHGILNILYIVMHGTGGPRYAARLQ